MKSKTLHSMPELLEDDENENPQDRFCKATIDIDKVFVPGLHAQDISRDSKIAILFSHTPSEVCDEQIGYEPNQGEPRLFEKYDRELR